MIFKEIYANSFFTKYSKQVKNWKHKSRGKNGRGNEVAFSEEDYKQIKKGLIRQHKVLIKHIEKLIKK